MKTRLLMPDEAVAMWPTLSVLLQKALDQSQGETSLTEHLRRILNFDSQLWLFTDDNNEIVGCGLTHFIEYNTHKSLHIVACAGKDWSQWADQYYVVEEFARRQGCKRVEMWGREGWLRRLPKIIPGWKQAYVVMTKDIQESSNDNEIN